MNDETIIIGGDCQCGCHDVKLVQEQQPIVLLFDEYGEQYQDDIVKTREAAEETLEIVKELEEGTYILTECSKKEVEQMYDGEMWDEEYMWLPSMDIDDDGYIPLNIEMDIFGYANFMCD